MCVCACVCVFITLTDRPQPYDNLLRKTKMRLPIRSVVCWTGGKKGNKKGAAPGYKLQRMRTKTIPPEAKSEIPNPVEKDKAQQKQRQKKQARR